MKTSCISHPPKTPLIIIRQEYLAICDGNHCEAAILNQFEYWTNIKLGQKEQAEIENEIAQAGGLEGIEGNLWIYKTHTELHKELMGLFGIRAVGTALQSLVDRGFLERRNNPKYAWDRTYQYRLETRIVQDAILQKCKMEETEMQSQKERKRDIEPPETAKAIPEITTENTPEIDTKNISNASQKPKIADPLSFELERLTVENKEVNYATPDEDALVETAIACLYDGNGPMKGSGTWHDMANTVKPIHADFGLHDEEIDKALAVIRAAIALFLEEKRQMAVYRYPSFTANYGHYLSRAMNGDTKKPPRPRNDPDKFARARAMTLERLKQRGDQ